MTPNELTQLLAAALPARANVLVVGPPGIGKTDIVHEAARSTGFDVILSHPAVQDPTAATGLPWIDGKGGATHLPFGNLARAIHATQPTVWFLDDLGQAAPAVQAAYMQLLLARELDGQRISDAVTFVAATNRRSDRAGVSGVLEPVKSRFATIVELNVDHDSWRRWAVKANLSTELIAFITLRPELLSDFKPTAEMTNSPSPRGWAHVDKWLKAGLPLTILEPAIAGAVGAATAAEFTAFYAVCNSMPDPRKVLADPETAPIPSDASVLWALVTALAAHAANAGAGAIDAFVKYTRRLLAEGHAEMATVALKDLLQRSGEAAGSLAVIGLLTDRSSGLTELLTG